jgi:phenylpropionate dioxygenase-like ring-hydroxylating dioxygenase large terminal subunit
LLSVPQERSDFAFDDNQRANLSLKNFKVGECGSFVFVRISKTGPELNEFLGDYFTVLQGLSEYFCDPIHEGQYLWNTNWKLAVETVLEVYHVPGVHPESFVKLAKPSCEITTHLKHNTGTTPLQKTPQKWWAGVRKHLKLSQHPTLQEYDHFFIYPNLAIGLTNGSLMSVQTYEPTSATESTLSFSLRMVKRLDGEKSRDAVKQAVKSNFVEFNHTTLEEDRLIAQSCQQNMAINNTPGMLGKCEGRLIHFHQSWNSDIEQDHAIEMSQTHSKELSI